MAMRKILLVEDDKNLGTVLKDFLALKNFEVDHTIDGSDGLQHYNNAKYDLLILDVMMPKLDGFNLAKQIRKGDAETPIIFLTAKTLQNDKIEGLRIGADDYITKPFNTEELLLRINAVLKRSYLNHDKIQNDFVIGKYKFNYERRILSINESSLKLTSKEAELLRLLCINKNESMEREFALTKIWNEVNYFTGRSMDVYIAKLRNYLKEDSTVEIANIHGIGFKLIAT